MFSVSLILFSLWKEGAKEKRPYRRQPSSFLGAEQQSNPRQPQRACAESMPGLSKAQLYSAQRKHETAAPSASSACVKFCHFAAVSAPALGLVLEDLQGQGVTAGAGCLPSRCCVGSQQGWWIPESFPPRGRQKPQRLEARLVSAPAGLTLCTSLGRDTADSAALQTLPALQKSQKTKLTFSQVQLEKGGGGTLVCIAFLGLAVF